MTGTGQLGLPFRTRPQYDRAGFIAAASNAEARHWLEHGGAWPDGRLVLWGPAGCGKTHLGHLWAGGAGCVLYGPALEPSGEAAARAAGGRLVVDAADGVVAEAALLHLINTAAEAGTSLLLTGRSPPARWGCRLADLVSRLRATQPAAIGPPEDALLRGLFVRLLAQHQLMVPGPVQDWLLVHLPRDAGTLRSAAALLDAAALARHVPVTRRLARDCLHRLLGPSDEPRDGEGSRQLPLNL